MENPIDLIRVMNRRNQPISPSPALASLHITYEGGSICNENPFIAPSTNALGFNAICQTKDQSVAVIMVHETLFHLSKFYMLQAF